MARTKQGKTRDINQPYEVYVNRQSGWEWRVLKKYKAPEAEAEDRYARWLCAVKSPMTFNGYDLGDSYVTDIRQYGELAYRENPGKPEDNWTAEWYTPEAW